MTREEALELRNDIIEMVVSRGQWVTHSTERKPDIKKITLEISIKIDEGK